MRVKDHRKEKLSSKDSITERKGKSKKAADVEIIPASPTTKTL